jgi:uncharacterized metal-binding protein
MTQRLDLAGACALGCLAGLVISPDLDLRGISYAEWVWTRIPLIGWLLTGIWFTYWLVYPKLVRRHRGISHVPVIGTLTRVAYLAPLVTVIGYWAGVSPTLELAVVLGSGVIGLAISDLGHWGRDLYGWEI